MAKAFDTVSHPKLLHRLKNYGIGGFVLTWCAAFLSDRHQRVKVGCKMSDWQPVVSGVPQGTVLGPIFFLIFINEMASVANNSRVKFYADDAKFYGRVNTKEDVACLQKDLNSAFAWSEEWQLKVATQKCGVLHIDFSRSQEPPPTYLMGGTQLDAMPEVKDLGVLITPDLKFKTHCEKLAAKALQRVGLIYRGFCNRDPIFLKKLFVAYVRPILETSTSVWSPAYVTHSKIIETVQRRFSKRVPGCRNKSYSERLEWLQLRPLSWRRDARDLVEVFKICRGFSPLKFSDFFIFQADVGQRGHHLRLRWPHSRTNRKAHFFSRRANTEME